MQINSTTMNPAQQTYIKSNNSNITKNETSNEKTDKEAIALNIEDSKQTISSNDKQAVRARIEEISEQLSVDYAEEMENFSKNNVNFFEGSLLTAQSSNIKSSVTGLLSE